MKIPKAVQRLRQFFRVKKMKRTGRHSFTPWIVDHPDFSFSEAHIEQVRKVKAVISYRMDCNHFDLETTADFEEDATAWAWGCINRLLDGEGMDFFMLAPDDCCAFYGVGAATVTVKDVPKKPEIIQAAAVPDYVDDTSPPCDQ